MKKLLFLATLFTLPRAEPAEARSFVCSYVARLGAADHFNSRGDRLNSAAAVIRQDRANFNLYNRIDKEDQGDLFFVSRENRALLDGMLPSTPGNAPAFRKIVNGQPLVAVTVWSEDGGRYSAEVELLEE